MKSAQYRPDIDGLRFFAVIPVVLFHAGISGFSGGFVGVDVFFVISGYLITRIILSELDQKKFSIVRFYERRIRRIFPALFALIAFVCIVSPLALLPSELKTLPYEILGALAFVANIVFWQQSDYFTTSAEEKPLLHTWSLGVEEQFYIFVPLILWLLVRYARRGVLPMILAGLAVSCALSIWLTPLRNSAAFYLLPPRAWELLIGSVLATGIPRMRSPVVNESAAGLGLLCLLAAVFTFDEHTSFPGYAAALPVMGSALIIQFAQGTAVGRLLGSRPLVFIGLISYSLYLWHWPLVVFFRDWGLLESMAGRGAVVVLSVILAWASWKFIETPFRRPVNWPRLRLFWFAGIGSGVLAATAGALYLTDGWPSRFTPENVAFDQARNDISPERQRCHINWGRRPFETLCRLGTTGDQEPDTLLWGDSHGVEVAAAFAEAGLPLIQATYSSCPPALNFVPRGRPDCKAHNDDMLASIEKEAQIKTVLLSAFYYNYSGSEFWSGMQQSIARLQAAGKRVIVIASLPNFGMRNIPSYLASGHRGPLEMSPVPPEFAEYITDVPVVSLTEKLCSGNVCSLTIDGKPLLFDHSHLSMTATRSVAASVVQDIRGIIQGH
ncbi:acyltransferase family protein [Mangrovicoccus ximenensis]|uniref:acyltransferase family protein n=1 Tax=Mangrovicoccus ximenensis TaxID=1911570 RepID=UPI000D33C262|nr:acyltransferase family protein [Mangrovicoccus ximenensis]